MNEIDLCRIAQVCRRFKILADDERLWKKLYQNVFEYDKPLYYSKTDHFSFAPFKEQNLQNPWKTSFNQLKIRCLHVRKNYNGAAKDPDRRMPHFDRISDALIYAQAHLNNEAKIFVHIGTYYNESLFINSNIQIIGAASGSRIANRVIIEGCSTNSAIVFCAGASKAYLGYVTVVYIPYPSLQNVPRYNSNCIDIRSHCSPTIDSCIIQNCSKYIAAIKVRGSESKPYIHDCCFVSCKGSAISFSDYAEGTFDNNELYDNVKHGILVMRNADPLIRQNHVHHGKLSGVFVFEGGEVIIIYVLCQGRCPTVDL